MVMHQATELFD